MIELVDKETVYTVKLNGITLLILKCLVDEKITSLIENGDNPNKSYHDLQKEFKRIMEVAT